MSVDPSDHNKKTMERIYFDTLTRLHEKLLEEGLDPEIAAPISRVMAFEFASIGYIISSTLSLAEAETLKSPPSNT